MSYVASVSHLDNELWTTIRTEHFLGLLLTILKHYIKSLDLFFS